MPRFYPSRVLTTTEKVERAKKFRVRGYKQWVDPFPTIHGTLPEKMVYAELSRRRIPFLFLNDIKFEIPEIEFNKEYQADFVIPSLMLIIEVQGAFWHSKPKALEADAFKFAIYETKGYRVIAWWDFDIISRLPELFAADPQLMAASGAPAVYASAELPVQSRKKQDTSKGIRTLNRKRAIRMASRKKPIQEKRVRKTKPFSSFTNKVK